MSVQSTSSVLINAQTNYVALNDSAPEGCITIRFSELEFLPWNNSDNIVSKEVETYTSKVRSNALIILSLIGGPANVINMAVFFKQGLRDRVNLLLFSQSLADVLFLVTSVLHYVEDFYFQFTGETKMRLLMFIIKYHVTGFQGFGYVSFALSGIVACERCYCVLRPLKYHTLMRTRTLALIILVLYLIVPGLYFIVVFKYFLGCVYDPDTGISTFMYLHSAFYRRYKDVIDYLDIVVFGAGLPSAVVMVVVAATVVTVSQLRRAAEWRAESASSLSAKEVALTKMLVGTSVLLIVCLSPVCLLRLACLFLPELNTGARHQNMYLSFLRISLTCTYVNSSVNIFVYYKMGSRYRETLWALLKGKGKGKD